MEVNLSMKFFLLYILFINILSFILMLIDKKKAIKKKWRISEQTLLSVSFIGGSLGAYLAMILFRHKTKHFKFKYGLPLMIIFHCFFFSIVIKKIV